MSESVSVAIGYVHSGYSVNPNFMMSVTSFQFIDWAPGGRNILKQIMNAGGLYVDHNRNSLTYLFLKYEPKIDYLLMVDTDIAFAPIDVYAMVDAAHPVERPVISGLYYSNFTDQKLGVQPLWYTAKDSWTAFSHFTKPINLNGHVLHPIDACGAGFMLVHRSVFEKIAELHPDEHYKWFKHIEVDPDTVPMGEDLVFPVDGLTPVLGADWKWRSIGDYKIGDELLSFEEQPTRCVGRRFQKSFVEGIVERRLPRIRLITDENEIITTLEHPWLTNNGKSYDNKRPWIWRSGAELKPGMVLTSIINPVDNPNITNSDYMYGYIQGLLHSDGTHNSSKELSGIIIRMKDVEPLERASTLFSLLGIESIRGPAWWDGNPSHAPMHRLGVYRKEYFNILNSIWKMGLTSKNMAAGYLAGMFDGDGYNSNGTLGITSRRDSYKDRIQMAADMLGIIFTTRDEKGMYIFDRNTMFDFYQKTLPALSRRCFPLGNHGSLLGKRVIHRPVRIVAIENIDSGDVRCLKTSSSTFIADGFASHNCRRIHEAGIPIYGLGAVVTHCKTVGLNAYSFIKDHPNYIQQFPDDGKEIEHIVKLKQVA